MQGGWLRDRWGTRCLMHRPERTHIVISRPRRDNRPCRKRDLPPPTQSQPLSDHLRHDLPHLPIGEVIENYGDHPKLGEFTGRGMLTQIFSAAAPTHSAYQRPPACACGKLNSSKKRAMTSEPLEPLSLPGLRWPGRLTPSDPCREPRPASAFPAPPVVEKRAFRPPHRFSRFRGCFAGTSPTAP